MPNNKNKLYALVLVVCFVGYIWLYINTNAFPIEDKSINVCLIKNIIGIPCPSCGSTRSIICIAKGDFFQALKLNPIGYLISFAILLAPFWIILDLTIDNNSFYYNYRKIEIFLKKPKYAIPLILLLIINWIWSISKGL